MSGNVFVPALGFNNTDALRANEQRVIGGTALGWPFCDGHIPPLCRSGPGGITHFLGIDLPATSAKLGIDERAGGRLIDVDFSGGGVRLGNDGGHRLCRRLRGDRLKRL